MRQCGGRWEALNRGVVVICRTTQIKRANPRLKVLRIVVGGCKYGRGRGGGKVTHSARRWSGGCSVHGLAPAKSAHLIEPRTRHQQKKKTSQRLAQPLHPPISPPRLLLVLSLSAARCMRGTADNHIPASDDSTFPVFANIPQLCLQCQEFQVFVASACVQISQPSVHAQCAATGCLVH